MTLPSGSLPQENAPAERHSRVVRCPKCRRPSVSRSNTCESCGSHLYVSCRDCGERNSRSQSRCTACGRRLHRPFLQKLLNKKFGRSTRITPLQIVILAIAVLVGYKVIVYFVESLSQTHEGEAAGLSVSAMG